MRLIPATYHVTHYLCYRSAPRQGFRICRVSDARGSRRVRAGFGATGACAWWRSTFIMWKQSYLRFGITSFDIFHTQKCNFNMRGSSITRMSWEKKTCGNILIVTPCVIISYDSVHYSFCPHCVAIFQMRTQSGSTSTMTGFATLNTDANAAAAALLPKQVRGDGSLVSVCWNFGVSFLKQMPDELVRRVFPSRNHILRSQPSVTCFSTPVCFQFAPLALAQALVLGQRVKCWTSDDRCQVNLTGVPIQVRIGSCLFLLPSK